MASIAGQDLASTIKSKLIAELKATHVQVDDTSGGCGASYTCVIVSDVFQGIPLLKRHRMINDLLKDEIAALHAFSQKCLTASQWEEQKAQIK